MATYLILQDPGHNRVYYAQSKKMALAELTLACEEFDQECSDIRNLNLAGVHYLTFSATQSVNSQAVSYTHLTLPTTPYV